MLLVNQLKRRGDDFAKVSAVRVGLIAGKARSVAWQGSKSSPSVVASGPYSRALSRAMRVSPRLALVTVVRGCDGRLETLATVGAGGLQKWGPVRTRPPLSCSFVAIHKTS